MDKVAIELLPKGREFRTALTGRTGIILGTAKGGGYRGVCVLLDPPPPSGPGRLAEQKTLHGAVLVEDRGFDDARCVR